MFIIGFIISLIGVYSQYAFSEQSPLMLLDMGSFTIVFGSVLTALIVSNSIKEIFYGFNRALRNRFNNKDLTARIILSCELSYKSSIYGGIIGLTTGTVLFLLNFYDKTAIGPGVSMAILSIVYGLFFAICLFLPLMINIQNSNSRAYDIKNKYKIILISLIVLLVPFIFFLISIKFALGELLLILYPPDFILILALLAGAIISSKSFNKILRGIDIIINKNINDKEDIESIIRDYEMIITVSVIAGIIAAFNNIIIMLLILDKVTIILHRIVYSMMPLIYGFIIGYLIFFPVKRKLESLYLKRNL